METVEVAEDDADEDKAAAAGVAADEVAEVADFDAKTGGEYPRRSSIDGTMKWR